MNVAKLLIALMIICTAYFSFAPTPPTVEYPTGYREWSHVKSAVVGPKAPASPKYEGLTHLYANTKALEGYKTGKFPEGAVIVYDVLELTTLPNTVGVEGKRKFIDVMVKDSRYDSTGGWGFQEFFDNKAVLKSADQAKCFQCHKKVEKKGFVFSTLRE